MIWKTRDTQSDNIINYPFFDDTGIYHFVGFTHAGSRGSTWAGVNTAGFAILNSVAEDMPGTAQGRNGFLMTHALRNFATISEFENYLTSTNETGRIVRANFAVIDALGNAAMFEVGDTMFIKYDINDPEHGSQGYMVRSNFSYFGDGENGRERYNRSHDIISGLMTTTDNSLSPKSIINYHFRDFSDDDAVPFPIPFTGSTNGHPGYINIRRSICNTFSTAAMVIEGINSSDEVPVMWTLSGFPAVTPAIPYIPVPFTMDLTHIPLISFEVQDLLMDILERPHLMNTNHFYLQSLQGIWEQIGYFEIDIFANFNSLMESEDFETIYPEWLKNMNTLAHRLMYDFMDLVTTDISDETIPIIVPNTLTTYPNPHKGRFYINLKHNFVSDYTIEVFNVRGQLIHTEQRDRSKSISSSSIILDSNIPSGVYLIQVSDHENVFTAKTLVIK